MVIEIYCDFDGTITKQDTVDLLLSELADLTWMEIEDEWIRGDIGSRECLQKQIPLIKGGWKAIESVLNTVIIDPTFINFVTWCSSRDIPLMIVSDGLDKVINALFLRENIIVDKIWSNHLEISSNNDCKITFPHRSFLNSCQSGLCKCSILEQTYSKRLRVVIGDGLSDFCWSNKADLLFAKSKLLDHCQLNNISHKPLDDFNTVISVLNKVFEETLLQKKSVGVLQQGVF